MNILSMILLDIEGSRIIGYVYTLPDADRSQLNVQKFEFQKDSKSWCIWEFFCFVFGV